MDTPSVDFELVTVQPTFTDDPLVRGVTPIKAIHVSEVRFLVDRLRERYGLRSKAWTDQGAERGVTPIAAAHVAELLEAIGDVYSASHRPRPELVAVVSGVVRGRAYRGDRPCDQVAARGNCGCTGSDS